MPGFDAINPDSPWLPPNGDMEQAKQLMGEVANPKKNITLYINDSPGHKEIAVAIQAAWKELGITSTIKQQECQQYLEFLGPPPNQDVDVYRLGWIGDFVDAINFLELWTCKSGNNNTNFCNKEYDALIEKAQNTAGQRRPLRALRRRPRTSSFGENGDVPIMPIYWYTYVNLERESREGHVQRQPAQPDRPDQGRRHRIALARAGPGTGPTAPRPRFSDNRRSGRRQARC